MMPNAAAAARCSEMEVRLADVEFVAARRHLLRHIALEIFCRDGTTFFFAFESTEARGRFHREVARAAASAGGIGVDGWSTLPSAAQIRADPALTQRWRERTLSTFDYIMHLNSAAGRTYNDLTQYPIFPWVVADYASKAFPFDVPRAFRDLTKPIGALNPQRLARVMERFIAQKAAPLHSVHGAGAGGAPGPNAIAPFMYGSHYSHPGAVIDFMLRIEPFTALHVLLQGGRFDLADRLFSDVGATWGKCSGAAGDVREAVPELYYFPALLRNGNALPLGEKQDGVVVDDVALPSWAHGSPHSFVRIARAALESECVSAHVHHWIDLVFGASQRGVAAERANNVFFHLTYEGAVQWGDLGDPRERSAVEAQISSFGQCPSQLFTKPHPARLSLGGALAARFPRAHDGARRTSRRCVRRSTVALHSARR